MEPEPEPEPDPEPEPEPEPEPQPVPKTPAIRHSLQLSLEELLSGTRRRLALSRRVRCAECSGSGTRAGRVAAQCEECGGDGVLYEASLGLGLLRPMQRPCTACGGTGQLMEGRDKCRRCRGAKQVLSRTIVDVDVPPGARARDRITVAGKSDEPADGVGEPGDLVVTLAQRKHPRFRRVGDDLLLDVRIPLRTALCGGSVSVVALDGKRLRIDCPAGLRPSDMRSIAGHGFPSSQKDGKDGTRGRLLLRFVVDFPSGLSAAATETLAAVLRKTEGEAARDPGGAAPAGDAQPDRHDVTMLRCFAAEGRSEPLLAEEYGGICLGFDSVAAVKTATTTRLKSFLGQFGRGVERGTERDVLVATAQRLYIGKSAERARQAQRNAQASAAEGAGAADSRVEEIPLDASEKRKLAEARAARAAAPPTKVVLVEPSHAAKAGVAAPTSPRGEQPWEAEEEDDYSPGMDSDSEEGEPQQCAQQ